MDRNEKSFEVGQKVRIIGPTTRGAETHVGECFTIDQISVSLDKFYEYYHHDCNQWFPASSLELAEPEYVTDEPPTAHRLAALQYQCQKNDSKIDELESRAMGRFNDIEKRLQALEDKAQVPQDARVPEEDSDYELYNTICKKPGSGVYDLAKELGWSSDKAYGSLRRLVKDGWVMAVRDGRSALKIMPVKWHEFLTPEEIEEFKKGDSEV